MSIFRKKSSPNSIQYIEKLNKEIAIHVEMNQELKEVNEGLKREVLSQQKELARFEQSFRQQPLSQLQILSQELNFLLENLDEVISNSQKTVADQMADETKHICTLAFELLNKLKEV